MSDTTIRELLTGSLLEIDTPLGTTVPVRFASSGLVSGEAGSLASVLGAPKDRGRWWTQDDHLCVKWFRWFEAETRCAQISRDGDRLLWRGTDGKTGSGRIAESGTPAKPDGRAQTTVPADVERETAGDVNEEVASKTQQAPADGPMPPPGADEMQSGGVQTAAQQPEPAAQAAPVADVAVAAVASAASADAAAPSAAADTVTLDPAAARLTAARIAAARIAAPFATLPVKTVPVTPSESDEGERSRFALAAAFPPILAFAAEHAEAAAAAPAQPAAATPAQATAAAEAAARAPKAAVLSSAVARATFRVAGVDADDALNVRSGPSQDSEIVGEIAAEGSGVVIVGACRESWCPIEHDRVRGWVNRSYLAAENVRAIPLR